MKAFCSSSLFLVFSIQGVFGTHLRGGQITFHLVDCASYTYEVTLTIYTNTQSPVAPGNGVLNFGDGSTMIVPGLSSTVIDGATFVGEAIFKVIHQFPSKSSFGVSYAEQNRNEGVTNMEDSGESLFFLESFIFVNGMCDQPMGFTIPPVDRACSQFVFTHNPGIVAPSEDSISYQLVAPLAGLNIPVAGFQYPNSPNFYAGNYQQANETHNGPATLQIDAEGTLAWDAPGNLGEYGLAIKVLQWKLIDSTWVNMGWVIRDMQILVEDCHGKRPFLLLPADLCVHPGDEVQQTIRGYDDDSYPVTIEVNTVDNFFSSPPQFLNNNKLQSTLPPYDTANVRVKWIISCDLVSAQPYKIIFKISNHLPNGRRLFLFQTWRVTVVGQPPTYQSLSLDVSKKALEIHWAPYPCLNAPTIEIYRRTDHDAATEAPCQPGIPRSWGFSKVGESSTYNFTDTHLAPGATYCYRLLAVYQTPHHAWSAASKDTCIGPLVIDAPVITTVSVNQTDKVQGSIAVKWTSPFEINRTLFSPPYEYAVQRTKDSLNYRTITETNLMDTTWVDSKLDVVDSLYGYRVIVYSPSSIAGKNPIDTSALAFYPRLNYQALTNGIKLTWDASVPWSNQTPRYPWHYIYRKEAGSSQFLLMDSVNVDTLAIPKGYEYFDFGTKPNFPLAPNRGYVYKAETQGVYGNPRIREPLQNFSNEIWAQPIDKTPPCAPAITVQTTPCETLINRSPCTLNIYKNTIRWALSECYENDVAFYKIFFMESSSSDTIFLAATSDSVYVHDLTNSVAGCYQVLAVDRSGNVGALSSKSCIENCTYLFMPNVMTVNADGMNETFPDLIDQSGKREPLTCPRFVKELSLQIFNRWGKEVFSAKGAPGETEWRGQDQNGNELSSGLYYYTAKVFFYGLSPEKQTQNFTGSVSLIR